MAGKDELRQRVWAAMTEARAALFPGAQGRIPNFKGRSEAAARIFDLEAWRRARVLKCNPDSPQQPLRKRALEEGKTVYMAVPRLTDLECFVELDPSRLRGTPAAASSIKGAFSLGRQVHPREMRPIDLIVCGTVAAARDGARLGKGGGFSDLEYAIVRSLGLAGSDTPIVTTVHALQVLEDGAIPMTRHDISLDFFATPDELVACPRTYPRPEGVYWEEAADKLSEAPILAELRTEAR